MADSACPPACARLLSVDAVPDVVLLVDSLGLRILDVNRQRGLVLGWPLQASQDGPGLLGTSVLEIVPGGSLDLFERARLGRHDPHPDAPLRVSWRQADGGEIPVDVRVARLVESDASSPLVCSVRALSESARVAERELVSVVCAVPAAIVTWRPDGTIMSFNPAAERLLGLSPAEALGQNVNILVADADRDDFALARARVFETGQPETREVLRLRGDTELMVEESLFLIRDVAWHRVRLGATFRDLGDVARLRRAAEVLRSSPSELPTKPLSPMGELLAAAEEAARDPKASILLLGETGVGKSHLAQSIHRASPRRGKPYFEVNCAGLDAQLAESELFGHERGAFTGAQTQKRGIVEAAEGGTLLLDEVAELPLVVQAKLLTFLDDGAFRRIGSIKKLQADVRIIAATNSDLNKAVEEGRFRRDLYFRLRVVPIELPPLRLRRDEIAAAATDIVAALSKRRGHQAPPLGRDLRIALERYDWPGNFRELKNVLERALILSRGGALELGHLPVEVRSSDRAGPEAKATRLDDVVRLHIARILEEVGGNRSRAAAILGIDRATLRRKFSASPAEGADD